MNLQRLYAVARKEFLHVLRDVRSLGAAIAIPLVMLVLFGYALSLDVDRVPLLVWDQSGTVASRELLSRFTGSRYFALRGGASNYRQIEDALDRGAALAALVIPADFGAQLGARRPARVQFILDGSDANTATIALGYAEAAVQTCNQEVLIEECRRAGARPAPALVDARPRVQFNADLESRNFIIPGLIAVIMMVIAALLTSLTIAREWERGTMEQLIATPVKTPELLLGKLIPYFVIGMTDVALAVGMGEYVFRAPLRGNVGLVFGMAAVFLIGALAFGMLISTLTRSQLLASQAAMLGTFLPAFLLSGFMFPIPNMPEPIQYLTYAISARYFVTLQKGIYLKGVGLAFLWPEALFLGCFGVVVLLAAHGAFRKRLE